jgi:hypothetical protein
MAADHEALYERLTARALDVRVTHSAAAGSGLLASTTVDMTGLEPNVMALDPARTNGRRRRRPGVDPDPFGRAQTSGG